MGQVIRELYLRPKGEHILVLRLAIFAVAGEAGRHLFRQVGRRCRRWAGEEGGDNEPYLTGTSHQRAAWCAGP
jgi:hypothetical protein